MRKILSVLLVIVVVMAMTLSNVAQTATAAPGSSLAPGNWQVPAPATGTVVTVTAAGAPSYLQLLTVGIKISSPAYICHQFTGAGYGWVGEIRQLVQTKSATNTLVNSWVKITTKTAKLPNTGDGVYTACAQAPSAGTYALFATYSPGSVIEEDMTDPMYPSSTTEDPGMWNIGNMVMVDLAKTPAPTGRTLVSTGIKLTQAAKICHPFRLGQFGLTGEIRQLVGNAWALVKTTNAWVPTVEGKFMSCAQAPWAGTYALFSADIEVAPEEASAALAVEDPGMWNTGNMVMVDLAKTPAPTGRTLVSTGIKLTQAAKICHPFRLGQFGLTGEIRQLVGNAWALVKTTNAWVPTVEGKFMSCAEAPWAGTYALFSADIEVAPEEASAALVVEDPGLWNTGNLVLVDLATNPAPSGRRLMSTGIKISNAAMICHPFREGQFDWTGEIRQLVGNTWTLVKTTNAWVPTVEGKFMSCAQAPWAGTYALFGVMP